MRFAQRIPGIVDQAAELLPEFEVWVYAEEGPNEDYLRGLMLGTNARVKRPPAGITNQMAWRFAPTIDPCVEIFLSRDADNDFIARDAAAVRDWMQSNYSCHVMRDHPQHKRAVMGGMWGFRNPSAHIEIFKRVLTWKHDKVARGEVLGRQEDQHALEKILWKSLHHDCLAHDAYGCTTRHTIAGQIRPFPTQRLNGEVIGFKGKTHEVCPPACRLEPDWINC